MTHLGYLASLLSSREAAAGPWGGRLGAASGEPGDEADSGGAGLFALPAGATVERDVAYGAAAEQRLDVYRPAAATAAPVLFMVHGGGWRRGDKAAMGVVRNKVQHWVARGWILVSTSYRMLPVANPLGQADDVARALTYVQAHASSWGADTKRVVLMGHSAGAHLVSLLAADPSSAVRSGALPWLGTIAIDSGAYDVDEIMRRRHFRFYDDAFGTDPVFWRECSPYYRVNAKIAAPMLLICSTRRSDSCIQAQAFAARANGYGSQVIVLPVDLSHAEANAFVGVPGPYTESIDSFIRSLHGEV